MSLRRFGPLIGIVLVATVVVLARLYDVQVREHSVWANEAAGLMRSARVEPHRRGTIRDRNGRVLVRDEEVYELDFVWRDFRREHPLGIVAQLRSLVLSRPVSLVDTAAHLDDWAVEFANLAPQAIEDFGKGEGLDLGALHVPRVPGDGRRARRAEARAQRRASRASELHFYLRSLLRVDRSEWKAMRELRGSRAWERPYLELLGRARRGSADRDPAARRAELERWLRGEVDSAREHLARLAAEIDWQAGREAEAPADDPPLQRLVSSLEDSRRWIEDATADTLFEAAAGFGPERLGRENLEVLDLEWLERGLCWDSVRLGEWARQRGGSFDAEARNLAGHVFARSKLGPRAPADRVLDALAHVFVAPRDKPDPRDAPALAWEELGPLIVLDELAEALEDGAELPRDLQAGVLPLQDPALRGAGLLDLELLTRALADQAGAPGFEQGGPGVHPAARGCAHLIALASSSRRDWDPHQLDGVESVLRAWNERVQARAAELLAALAPDGRPVELAAGRVDRALEDRDHVVKDLSARPQRLLDAPPYELVQLVTRYPLRYAGFRVRPTTERVAVLRDSGLVRKDGRDVELPPQPVLAQLIGRVRSPQLVKLLELAPETAELRQLQQKVDLESRERARILDLVARSYHPEQVVGGGGIEGYHDPELRGRNGYRESQGLQERADGGRASLYRAPVDGLDLWLTIDMELQAAAQGVLERPHPAPSGDPRPDDEWTRNPVGAIVLMSANGDVLAAASVPTRAGLRPELTHQDGQRALPVDRTLRQPEFQPPGSVFKPLVAAWAMECRGLDPSFPLANCKNIPGLKKSGYGHVECHNFYGHSAGAEDDIALAFAVRKSCNAYFAKVGERYFNRKEFQGLAAAFGFGQPTGVRAFGDDERRTGLREDAAFRGPVADEEGVDDLSEVVLQRTANGLSHITATPMQVARAYAGLATGVLPKVRLVQRVADSDVLAEGAPIPISAAHLALVRGLLDDVVNHPQGSAHGKGLDEESLGFRLAAKTGSADYQKGLVPDYGQDFDRERPVWVDGMRKHTWVAGWFPSRAPRAVLVVYVHDTATTSSHGAVYVAAQFLSDPAVRRWLEGVQ